MTNAKLQFSDDVTRFLNMFPGIAAFAQEVGHIGSLEQAATEAEARAAKAADDLKQNEAAWQNTQTQYLASCDKIKNEADAYAAKARSDADKQLQDAKAKAAKLFEQANNDGAGVMADAKRAASDFTNQINKAHSDLSDTLSKIEAAKSTLSDLNLQILNRQNEFNKVSVLHTDFLKSIGAK